MVEAIAIQELTVTQRGTSDALAALTPMDTKVDDFALPQIPEHGAYLAENARLPRGKVHAPKSAIIAAREFCDAVSKCQQSLQGFEHQSYQRLLKEWEESGQEISDTYRNQAWFQAGFALISAVCIFTPILINEQNLPDLPFADLAYQNIDAGTDEGARLQATMLNAAVQAYKSMIQSAGSSVIPGLGKAWDTSYQSKLNLLTQVNAHSRDQKEQASQAERQTERLIIELQQTLTQIMREARQASAQR
ncbi:MAG: hypothetical protein KAR79_06085 [Simkaniaceae bacterium]|nr:hypothetical protein [Simkaniaceae bacterium]